MRNGQPAAGTTRTTEGPASARVGTIAVPLAWYPRLLAANAEERADWEIAGGGYGIHWPRIDEDLSVEGLLRGAPAARAA